VGHEDHILKVKRAVPENLCSIRGSSVIPLKQGEKLGAKEDGENKAKKGKKKKARGEKVKKGGTFSSAATSSLLT